LATLGQITLPQMNMRQTGFCVACFDSKHKLCDFSAPYNP